MRNATSALLPPDHEIDLTIEPPIDPTKERFYVMTIRGKAGIVVTELAPNRVIVTNRTNKIAPVFAFVGEIGLSKLPAILNQLFNRGSNKWLP